MIDATLEDLSASAQISKRIAELEDELQELRSQQAKICTSFTLFPKLPPEIRQAVWKFALPESKLITIYSTVLHELPATESQSIENLDSWHPLGDHTPPLFDVCHEARKVFTTSHTLLHGTDGKKGRWVNFERDVICILRMFCFHHFDTILVSMPEEIRSSIRYLHLDLSRLHSPDEKSFDPLKEAAKRGIARCTGLRQLLVGDHEIALEGKQLPSEVERDRRLWKLVSVDDASKVLMDIIWENEIRSTYTSRYSRELRFYEKLLKDSLGAKVPEVRLVFSKSSFEGFPKHKWMCGYVHG